MEEIPIGARVSALEDQQRAFQVQVNGNMGAILEAQNGMRREMNARFDAIEGRFDAIDGRFDALEGRFDRLEGRFDTLEGLVRQALNLPGH